MKKLFVLLLVFSFLIGVAQAQQTYTANGTWNSNPEPTVVSYDVLRGPSGGPYTLVVSVPQSPTPSFQETGLSGPNCWVLKAIDTFGLESGLTPESCVGPGVPTGFSLTITVTVP